MLLVFQLKEPCSLNWWLGAANCHLAMLMTTIATMGHYGCCEAPYHCSLVLLVLRAVLPTFAHLLNALETIRDANITTVILQRPQVAPRGRRSACRGCRPPAPPPSVRRSQPRHPSDRSLRPSWRALRAPDLRRCRKGHPASAGGWPSPAWQSTAHSWSHQSPGPCTCSCPSHRQPHHRCQPCRWCQVPQISWWRDLSSCCHCAHCARHHRACRSSCCHQSGHSRRQSMVFCCISPLPPSTWSSIAITAVVMLSGTNIGPRWES